MTNKFKEEDTVFLISPNRSKILKGKVFRYGLRPNDFEDVVLSYFVRIEHMNSFTSCEWIPEDDLFESVIEAQERLRTYNSGYGGAGRLFVGEKVFTNVDGKIFEATIKSVNNKVYPIMYHLSIPGYIGVCPVVSRSQIFLSEEDAKMSLLGNYMNFDYSEDVNYNNTHACV